MWQRTWLVCGKWFVTALEGIGEEGGKDQDRQPWLLRGLESSYQHDVAPEAGEAVFPQTASIAGSFSETETNPAARVQTTGRRGAGHDLRYSLTTPSSSALSLGIRAGSNPPPGTIRAVGPPELRSRTQGK